MAEFTRALTFVLKHEGGYVRHPKDPGGETKFGISKRAYPNEDIAALTKERAAALYHRDYWRAIRGDAIPFEIALCVFDGAVNSGVRRSVLWLQEALRVPMDGKVGPNTLARCLDLDSDRIAQEHCRIRLNYLRGLPHWPTFGAGWQRRVQEALAEALR